MRNVNPSFFVDTNVLAYVYDASDDAKRERATSIVLALGDDGTGAISMQVLSELYRALTKPRGLNLAPEVAEASVLRYARSWPVFDVSLVHVMEAMRGVRQHKLSYYDSLIWATARLNGIPYLLSEDGQDGRYLEGVRILNPLTADFDLALLS
jgi:predicted nucleic acid-binding protein